MPSGARKPEPPPWTRATREDGLSLLAQPSHDVVELIEIAIADMHGAAGIAVIDADGEPKRIADALLQCHRVRVLYLAAAPRLKRLARGHALDMRQRLGLTHVEPFFDDAFGGG